MHKIILNLLRFLRLHLFGFGFRLIALFGRVLERILLVHDAQLLPRELVKEALRLQQPVLKMAVVVEQEGRSRQEEQSQKERRLFRPHSQVP